MRKLSGLAIIILFLLSACSLPNPTGPKTDQQPTPSPTQQPSPSGLSAWWAWEYFQLGSGGNNGDLYSVSANSDSCLGRNGMVIDPKGYWILTYDNIIGKQYKSGKWEKANNSDSLGSYTPLNRTVSMCNGGEHNSWEAIKTADANGGSEYVGIWSMTAASGNGNQFGYPGRTCWVIIFKLESSNNPERLFLIDANSGQFLKRMRFLS